MKLGEYEKALYHAKMYLDICPYSEMKRGLDYLLMSLKGTDRNLFRVNQVLEYLKFGEKGLDGKKGTGDDLEDPFEEINM